MTPPTPAAREAWELVTRFMWSDDNQKRFHDACTDLDVTPPMLKAMLSLEPGEPRPMGHLADQLRCDASWVTALIDGLEERGYVERQPIPSDRRVKAVALTDEGAAAKKVALDRLHEPPSSFAQLNAGDARALRDLLRRAFDA